MTLGTHAGRDLFGSPPDPDAIIAALAARQHGLVSIEQLIAAGVNAEAVRRRVRCGRLHRVHRGVYAVGHAGLSFEGRCMAAVLACGPAAAASHLTCAEIYRTSRWPLGKLSVVTATKHDPTGLDVHHVRRLDPRDITRYRGIPVTTFPRLLIDLADIRTRHQLAWVINEGAFRHLLNLDEVRRAMQRANGRHNLDMLERAIELHLSGSAGTRSAAEDAFLESLPDHERDTAIVNTRLEVDVRWPDRKLAVEIDGDGHGRPPARRDDAERDERLRALGYAVRRVPARSPRGG